MKPLRVFIIQPFGAPHSDFFKTTIEEICAASEGRFESFRADEEFAVASRLQDRIDSYIKASDICVADLSGTRSENALLEVGAAYTLNIPVIPVSEKDLPSDIRGNLRVSFDPSKCSDEQYTKQFKTTLTRCLLEATAEIGKHFSGQFIAYGYHNRRNVDFRSLVARCQKRIWILTTNLGFFVNEKLRVGLNQQSSLLQIVAAEIGSKPSDFTVKIMSLDPDSNFTNDRATALDRDKREFRDAMRQDLESLIDFTKSEQCERSVQIKLYDESPLQMTYFFDSDVIASVVAKGISSRECVTYQHSLQAHGARETYERHFDNLWGAARLVASGPARPTQKHDWRD